MLYTLHGPTHPTSARLIYRTRFSFSIALPIYSVCFQGHQRKVIIGSSSSVVRRQSAMSWWPLSHSSWAVVEAFVVTYAPTTCKHVFTPYFPLKQPSFGKVKVSCAFFTADGRKGGWSGVTVSWPVNQNWSIFWPIWTDALRNSICLDIEQSSLWLATSLAFFFF